MLLRRATPLAVALAAIACEPSVPYDPTSHNPQKVDYGVFQPTPSSPQANPPNVPADIPLPNDLALLPQAIATQSPAQAALLTQWAAQGGFPNDQEVPITIDFVEETIDANTGAATRAAPALDTTSIKPSTLLILSVSLSSGTASAITYDAPKPTDYVTNGDHGTLTIHKSPDANNGGSRRWPANSEIVVAVRGGAAGVKVTGNAAGLQPQPAMFLLLQDQDLSLAQNQSLITCDPPLPCTREMKAAIGAQLELIRKQYAGLFLAIDGSGAFSHHEIATMGTFKIAPTTKRTHVETDPSAGRIPLPSDFLMDATGHLSADAQAAFGPLGPGLATLDGFSTTAMVLSQTSTGIKASTVAGGVFIYEVTSAAPGLRRLLEATEALTAGKAPEYAAEPPPITQEPASGANCTPTGTVPPYDATCLSTAIGLQPAVPVPLSPSAVAPIPPLKEGTTYIVLITDNVKDLNGDPLVRSTLGQILFLDPSISIASGGKSTVSGVSDTQAVGLDQMRVALNGAAQALAAEKSISRDHIVMGYTFKTQSITAAPLQLAALPYAPACSATVTSNCLPPAAVAALAGPVPNTTALFCRTPGDCPGASSLGITPAGTVNNVYDQYGIDRSAVPNAAPNANIAAVVQSVIVTLNNLTDPSGAFSDPTKVAPKAEPIPVIIAVPSPPNIAGCNLSGLPGTPCAAPLVVFRHGLGGNRAQMLLLADRFAVAGFVVAAIDAAKQGSRSYCMPAKNGTAAAECVSGSSCVADPTQALQGDTAATGTPGKCSGATPTNPKFVNTPVSCSGATCTGFVTANAGTPAASGNYLISGNLFRTRDTFRQDVIDESQLIHALAVNPLQPPTGSAADIFHAIAAEGVVIDPTRVYYAGQSMGAINGTVDVAVNPRITKAVLNVSGGTLVDIFTNAPAFAPSVNPLLASLGITAGTPAYLQFVNVAKWILDPADALNFSRHLTANTLPNLIKSGLPPPLNSDPMVPKKVLGQMAACDDTVPNAFNLEEFNLIPLGPDTGSTTNGTLTTFVSAGTISTACPGGIVKHGFLLDWIDYGQGTTSITQLGQDDAAAFLLSDTHPPLQRAAP